MTMAEYIKREALVHRLKSPYLFNITQRIFDIISEIPSADVAPVVHARWIYVEETLATSSGWCCSACRRPRWLSPDVPEVFKYCPNCGAKMDEGADNDTN